ncbi:MAG: hypothetical protein MI742_10160 [Desulfobacterales bacterium]|nr:hypothetical protein [Desulfobacterales bacterium]
MENISNSIEVYVKKQYYRTLDLAVARRHDLEDLRMRLISILYDVVDIELFQEVAQGVVESIEELTEGMVEPTLLDKYSIVLNPDTCSIEAFRPVCRDLLEMINRVLTVTREGRNQLRQARMHSMGIHVVK